MESVEIRIVDEAAPADVAELEAALVAFNIDTTGYADGRSLSCFLRDSGGRLFAGIDGFTWGGYAHIETLWVAAAARGQELGRRLLLAAEVEAARRGCRTITLDTHEFQAPDFYRALGYVVVGASEDTPLGSRQFFLQKPLSSWRVRG